MNRGVICLTLYSLLSSGHAAESPTSRAHYLANTGVMIERGSSRILFDPLFRSDYGIYDRVPAGMEAALFAGTAPFDGIDAVFISHHHGDHFDPALILKLLRAQTETELFAPQQAANAIRALAETDDAVLQRVHGLSLENAGAPIDIDLGSLLIEAIRVPHEGWPAYHASVENIVFRVTLDNDTTVMHFGDADPNDEHFAPQAEHWQERHTHFAMPPYWFFLRAEGRRVLEDRIGASFEIGVHVPSEVPDDPDHRPDHLQGHDLFTHPGKTRNIDVRH